VIVVFWSVSVHEAHEGFHLVVYVVLCSIDMHALHEARDNE
jgi:hypothetical protein